jgi:hypothetical protein
MANLLITFNLRGIEDVQRRLRALQRTTPLNQAKARGLFKRANLMMTAAKRDAPVDTGTLRASGTVFVPEVSRQDVSVLLGFGGPAAIYALLVHETHRTRSKFLERNVNQQASQLERDVAEEVDRFIRQAARS